MKKQVEKIHHSMLVVDLHSDSVISHKLGRDLLARSDWGHLDVPRLKEGGINLQIFASFIEPNLAGKEAYDRAVELIRLLLELISRSEDLNLCTTPDQVSTIVKDEKIAAMLSIENGSAINNDIANVDQFHSMGVRCVTLVHTKTNDLSSSSSDSGSNLDGLTEFGRLVVGRMNELGMIVDISHASVGAVDETLQASLFPIIASHSCVHAICQHDRNLTDEQIRKIAAKGGLIGVNFCGRFLTNDHNSLSIDFDNANAKELSLVHHLTGGGCSSSEFEENRAAYFQFIERLRKAMLPAQVTLEHVVDHIDYIVKIGGVEAVGIGSDFDGIPLAPIGLEDCSKMPKLTNELDQRGYKSGEIEKILGQNFMRVFRDISR